MQTSLRRLAVALVAALIATTAVSAPASAAMTSTSTACTNLIVLGFRGSGQSMGSGSVYGFGPQLSVAAKSMMGRVKRTGTYRFAGIAYTASKVGPGYYTSVNDGVNYAAPIINYLGSRCTSSRFALLGYSQGAHVVRNVMPKLSSSVRSRIVLVGLVGDPKRRGFNVSPAEVGYQEMFNSGTLYGSGALGAGTSYSAYLGNAASKVATFCVKQDPVCNRPGASLQWGWFSTVMHTTYYTNNSSTIGFGLYTRLSANGFR